MAIYILWALAILCGLTALVLWLRGLREISIWVCFIPVILATTAICLRQYSQDMTRIKDSKQNQQVGCDGSTNLDGPAKVIGVDNLGDSKSSQAGGQHKQGEPNGTNKNDDDWLNHFMSSPSAPNWFMFGATLALAILAFGQLIVSRMHARRQMRAYICVDEVRYKDFDMNTGNIQFIVVFKNTGQTPAHDFSNRTFKTVLPWPCSSDLPETDRSQQRIAKGILGPGQTNDRYQRANISSEEMRNLGAGTHVAWVHRYATYRDVFKKWHKLRYRIYFKYIEGITGRNGFNFDDHGNEEVDLAGPPDD